MSRRELFKSICEGGCLKICQKVSFEEGVDKLSISSVRENFGKCSYVYAEESVQKSIFGGDH